MIKNKKGLVPSLAKLVIYLLFGLGAWFIYSSAKDFVVEKFGSSPAATLIMGIIIVSVVLLFYKFKLHNLLVR